MLSFQGPSFVLISAAVLVFAAAILIWVIRKIKKIKIKLPILEIFPKENHPFRKLVFKKPPLVFFVLFVCLLLVCLSLLWQPHWVSYVQLSNQEKKRTHFFVDLSPSVSASIGITDLAALVEQLAQKESKGIIQYSTTHSKEVQVIKHAQELKDIVLALGYHKAGAVLKNIFKHQFEKISKADIIYIVSDRDKHSWLNFNWEYLHKEKKLVFIDVQKQKQRPNIYISATTKQSQWFDIQDVWDVKVARNYSGREAVGKIFVHAGEDLLAEESWHMDSDQREQTIRLSWDTNKDSKYLVWQVKEPDGNTLHMDDMYWSDAKSQKKEILITKETQKESILENNSYSLQNIFKVLGFSIKRVENLTDLDPKWFERSMLISYLTREESVSQQCPVAQLQSPLSKNIWLIPETHDPESLSSVCWCFANLAEKKSSLRKMPEYCRDIRDRNSFGYVMKSLGAVQVGGEIGTLNEALAWKTYDKHNQGVVLAFTVPFKPSRAYGISHGSFPKIVLGLLEEYGLYEGTNRKNQLNAAVQRLADISQEKKWLIGAGNTENASEIKNNVPLEESRLLTMPEHLLPPDRIGQHDDIKTAKKTLQRKDENAQSVIWFLATLVIFLLFVELIYSYLIFKKKKAV